MKDEIKVIKLLQQRADEVSSSHTEISEDLDSIKRTLLEFQQEGVYFDEDSIHNFKSDLKEKSAKKSSSKKEFSEIVNIANQTIPEEVRFRDILTDDDLLKIDKKKK